MVNFGSEEQKRRFLPSMLQGRVRFCLGVTEPDGTYNNVPMFQYVSEAGLMTNSGSWI